MKHYEDFMLSDRFQALMIEHQIVPPELESYATSRKNKNLHEPKKRKKDKLFGMEVILDETLKPDEIKLKTLKTHKGN